MRHFSLCVVLLVSLSATAQDSVLQFVFTSDVHYGITRSHFRGADSVSAVVVNRAMIAAINCLPASRLPADGGVGAGEPIGHLDGILITGDIANRQETGVQPATVSWRQFEADYDHLLQTKTGGISLRRCCSGPAITTSRIPSAFGAPSRRRSTPLPWQASTTG